MTERARELLLQALRECLGAFQTAATDLVKDVSRVPSCTPFDALTELDMALHATVVALDSLHATGIALDSIYKTMVRGQELTDANRRAARSSLAECKFRLELLYAQTHSDETEAILVALSSIELDN